ncbi:MAG TPA: hypothetical protein VMU49_08765 [Candidatus Acidoferrales bacterium]|nr:hypothetical protein [Candidatus Acidoferrales bacterium]
MGFEKSIGSTPPPPVYDRKPSRERIGAVIVPISTQVLSQVTAACPVFPKVYGRHP